MAREEAREVAAYLNRSGVNAVSLIGSEKASRFDTLRRLILDGNHLVHFAGHGTYDAVDPSKTGWVFKGGVLRAAEIRRMDTPPLVVFANACLSSKNSQRRFSSQPAGAAPPAGTAGEDVLQAPLEPTLSNAEKAFELERRPYGDAGLLPSLADEFFKCGVRNYIGAAWEVNDEGARAFALSFYEDVLDGKKSIGEALLEARLRLAKRKRLGCLWGAYQHYGDPGFTLR
ncbi:MAG: CHAT domain-containing protein [Bacteroidota bacterium]